jgi:hypothetical protein
VIEALRRAPTELTRAANATDTVDAAPTSITADAAPTTITTEPADRGRRWIRIAAATQKAEDQQQR